MIYLAANHASVWRLRAEGWPMGWCMSPDGLRRPTKAGYGPMPYALDNGLYHAPDADPKPEIEGARILAALARVRREGWHRPLFAVVPDVPYDMDASRERSGRWRELMRKLAPGCPLAVAVQDGAQASDLDGYDAVFVAGSTEWKWDTAPLWCERARERGIWSHIARVNTIRRVRHCIDMGANSSDGTGIFRGDRQQKKGVLDALVEGHLFEPATEA